MRPEELRIGNWITMMGSLPSRVTASLLHSMVHYVPADPNEANYQEMTEPITITEEWLLKFGFTQPLIRCWKKAIADNGGELESSIQIAFVGCGSAQVCRSGINAKSVPCRYVHQLQNLYFALTGEELTIKES